MLTMCLTFTISFNPFYNLMRQAIFYLKFKDLKLSVLEIFYLLLQIHFYPFITQHCAPQQEPMWTILWAPLPFDFLVGWTSGEQWHKIEESGIYYPMQLLPQSKIILLSRQSFSYNSPHYSLFPLHPGMVMDIVLTFVVFLHPVHCSEYCIFIKLSSNCPIWDINCFVPVPCLIR